MTFFNDVHKPIVERKLASSISLASKINERVQAEASKFGLKDMLVCIFGSISVFLCNDQSDVDIAIYPSVPSPYKDVSSQSFLFSQTCVASVYPMLYGQGSIVKSSSNIF